jgi:hypothetical protein
MRTQFRPPNRLTILTPRATNEGLSLCIIGTPKSQRPSAKTIPTLPGSASRKQSNEYPCHKGQVAWCDNLPPAATAPSLTRQGHLPRQNPVTVSTFPRYNLRQPFTNPSNAFRTQEWSNLARDNVSRLRTTPPLVNFLIVWFVVSLRKSTGMLHVSRLTRFRYARPLTGNQPPPPPPRV